MMTEDHHPYQERENVLREAVAPECWAAAPRGLRSGARVRMLLVACLCGLGLACNRSPLATIPVEGRVTLAGHDLSGVTVVFTPQADTLPQRPVSLGEIDAQGRFVLGTYGPRDGAPQGSYRVSFAARGGQDEESFSLAEQRLEAIPAPYRQVGKTPLIAEVTADSPHHFVWNLADDAGSVRSGGSNAHE